MNFKNLIEVTSYFSSTKNCIDFLVDLRWNNAPTCVFCGCEKVNRLKCNYGYHRCTKCKKMFSATKGTIFEKSQVPLQKWFVAIYIVTSHKKGISSIQLSKDLGITQKSSWFMLQRIRFALKVKSFVKMDGVIQADETYVGGKNKNRVGSKKIANSQGRSLKDKTPVFGMVQVGGIVQTAVIPNTQSATIKPLIEQMVSKGSIIITDEWKAYKNMSSDYMHVVMNHSQEEYGRGGFHNNTIENFWSLLKRGIYGIYHQVSPKHLDTYCDEFSFRYNTKTINDSDRFNLSMKNVNCRITYEQLTSKDERKTQVIQEP